MKQPVMERFVAQALAGHQHEEPVPNGLVLLQLQGIAQLELHETLREHFYVEKEANNDHQESRHESDAFLHFSGGTLGGFAQ